MFGEDVITADLEIARAARVNANNAFRSELLGPWWREGMKLVRRIDFLRESPNTHLESCV